MLQGGYSSVLQARDRDEFRDEVVRFAQRSGFDTVSAVTVIDHGIGAQRIHDRRQHAAGISASAFNDPRAMQRDPVMQHCKRQSVPIIWDQGTYTGKGRASCGRSRRGFGYHTGIAMALHLPEGKHFMLGVDRDQPLPTTAAN